MRRTCFVLAMLWGVLTFAALLASFGVMTRLGLWAHLIPADLMYSAADALGLHISARGLLLRSAHGPPFLGPLGLALWYVLPTIGLFVFARRTRRP